MESMNNKTKPKNRTRGCLSLHCFRPNDMDYDSFETNPFDKGKTTGPAVVTYIPVAEKEGVVFPTVLSPKCDGEGNGSRRRKKMNIGLLRRDKKATTTVDETSWAKKIINLRRKRNKDNKFKSSTSSNTEHETTHQNNSNASSFSLCSPSFTTSSSLSSSTTTTTTESNSSGTNARSPSSELKQKQDEGYCSNMAMCLPLISLGTLILWGKFCAILCTSIGFFLVPPRRRRPGPGGSHWRH